MIGRYVHVEVRELRRGVSLSRAEADCVVTLPDGETASIVAQLQSDRAPYWRVVSIDEFGNRLVARAIELIGEEALLSRVSVAASLWNVWDSLRAGDPLP